jgi:hypothetical protein
MEDRVDVVFSHLAVSPKVVVRFERTFSAITLNFCVKRYRLRKNKRVLDFFGHFSTIMDDGPSAAVKRRRSTPVGQPEDASDGQVQPLLAGPSSLHARELSPVNCLSEYSGGPGRTGRDFAPSKTTSGAKQNDVAAGGEALRYPYCEERGEARQGGYFSEGRASDQPIVPLSTSGFVPGAGTEASIRALWKFRARGHPPSSTLSCTYGSWVGLRR